MSFGDVLALLPEPLDRIPLSGRTRSLTGHLLQGILAASRSRAREQSDYEHPRADFCAEVALRLLWVGAAWGGAHRGAGLVGPTVGARAGSREKPPGCLPRWPGQSASPDPGGEVSVSRSPPAPGVLRVGNPSSSDGRAASVRAAGTCSSLARD